MITIAEQRFLEGVPNALRKIEANTGRIASALERLAGIEYNRYMNELNTNNNDRT